MSRLRPGSWSARVVQRPGTQLLTRSALAAIVVLAFAVRLAVLFPHAQENYYLGISPVFGAWGFNLAAFGRWWLVEESIASPLGAASLERGRLVDPAELLAEGLVPQPADVGSYNFEMPGQGVFIGLVWAVTRDYRYVWPLLAQAALDSLACILAYLIAATIWGRLGGLLGALAYALFLPQAHLVAFPMYNVWTGPLLLALVAAMCYRPRGGRPFLLHAAGVGTLAGVATLFSPIFIAVLAPLALVVAWRVGLRQAAIWTLVGGTVCLLVLTPWSLRNQQLYGEFRPTASAFWYNIYYGMGELPGNPYGWTTSDDLAVQQVREALGYTTWHSPASEGVFRPLVLQGLAQYPGYYAGVVLARAVSVPLLSSRGADQSSQTATTRNCYRLTTEPAQPPPTQAVACDPRYTPLNPWPAQTAGFLEWLWGANHPWQVPAGTLLGYPLGSVVLGFPLLAAVGLAFGLRRAPGATATLTLTGAYVAGMYALFHIEPRYVAGIQALVAMAAGGGLASLIALAVREAGRVTALRARMVRADPPRPGIGPVSDAEG
jgi:hypothetical protein